MTERRPDRARGPEQDEFWQWCAQGELRLQRCLTCGELCWPAVAACEFCGGPDVTWERLSGRGRVVAWTTFERDYYAGMLPIPWDTILVELAEGPLFLSNPKGFGWRDITIGMPVKVAFLDCEDGAGAFSLPVFGRDLETHAD
jgi:uncharacterized OB-fold protein